METFIALRWIIAASAVAVWTTGYVYSKSNLSSAQQATGQGVPVPRRGRAAKHSADKNENNFGGKMLFSTVNKNSF